MRRLMTIRATITDVPRRAAITMALIAPGPRDPAGDRGREREKGRSAQNSTRAGDHDELMARGKTQRSHKHTTNPWIHAGHSELARLPGSTTRKAKQEHPVLSPLILMQLQESVFREVTLHPSPPPRLSLPLLQHSALTSLGHHPMHLGNAPMFPAQQC